MVSLGGGFTVRVRRPDVTLGTNRPGVVSSLWLKQGPVGPPGTNGAPGGVTSVDGATGVVTIPSASTTVQGKVELATTAETTTGTDTTRAVTAAGVKAVADTKQPLDTDLTTIAGLTATTDNIIQSVSGAWASRTPAQARLALEVAGSTGGGREKSAALSATTGTCTGDLATASVFTITPSGNWTLAFSNVPATGTACTVTVIVAETATIRAMTQPTGTTFIGAAAPTVVASKVRIYTYLTVDGGTTWYASASVQP